MMKYRAGIGLLLLALTVSGLLLSGCSSTATGSGRDIPKPDQEVLDSLDASLADAYNQMGIDMFKRLAAKEDDVFISPLSIAAALAMTYNGAGNETAEAMAKTLGASEMKLERFNENNLALLYLLQEADPSVTLHIANSLWLREGIDFDEDFVKRNENYFNAAVKALNFNSPEAATTINRWVFERTGERIEDMISDIDPLTVLFLINAVYFQGDWTEPFAAEDTYEDSFFPPGGEPKTIPFMHRTSSFNYYQEEGFQSVRLPYGENKSIAMYVFLPREGQSLQSFLNTLTPAKWQQVRGRFSQTQVGLHLPKFTMEYEKSLNDVLKAMGMEVAFDPDKADFFGMLAREEGPRLYISEVKHKSFIQVDEKGTEAAAATSVEMRLTAAPEIHNVMKVDRPFFFLIEDQETGAILFMGSVTNPQEPGK